MGDQSAASPMQTVIHKPGGLVDDGLPWTGGALVPHRQRRAARPAEFFPTESGKILLALQRAFDDGGPERRQSNANRHPQGRRVCNFQQRDPMPSSNEGDRRHDEPEENGGLKGGAQGSRELAMLPFADGGGGLLRENNLEPHRRN